MTLTEASDADSLVKNWGGTLHRLMRASGVIALFGAFAAPIALALHQEYTSALFATALAFPLVYTFLRERSLAHALHTSWTQDFSGPVNRLLQTIQMIEAQHLELLPEEKRASFTYAHQQKLLEVARTILEHQRFVDQVVDNMFEMMFLLNPDGVILKANKSACETTRYQASELVGQHIRKIFPHAGTLVDYFLELEIRFTTEGVVRDMEVHVQTAEGEVIPFSLNGVKIESSNGDLLGYTLIAKNLSEIFQLINQLNKSNFDLNRANSELEKRYDQIKREIAAKEGQRRILEHELATSHLVQKTFLPQTAPCHPRVEAAGTSIPAAYCGGDWWNTIELEDKFFVFIGDVTGHGTASAMVTAAVSGYYVSIREALKAGARLDVADILRGFHSVLTAMANEDVSYNMTCFACVFDFTSRTIRFANAGHNFPLLIRESSTKIEPLVVSGNRLGSSCEISFQTAEVPLNGGEFVLFYTDGLIENKNSDDDAFGKRRLRKFMEAYSDLPPTEFVKKLIGESVAFQGADRTLEDDVTFVALRIKPLATDVAFAQ